MWIKSKPMTELFSFRYHPIFWRYKATHHSSDLCSRLGEQSTYFFRWKMNLGYLPGEILFPTSTSKVPHPLRKQKVGFMDKGQSADYVRFENWPNNQLSQSFVPDFRTKVLKRFLVGSKERLKLVRTIGETTITYSTIVIFTKCYEMKLFLLEFAYFSAF